MDADLMAVDHAMAWLYLPGFAPGRAPAPRHRWPGVLACLRAELPPDVWPAALQRAGFWEEALLVSSRPASSPGGFWSAAHPLFPARWLAQLDYRCPPVFWAQGALPAVGAPAPALVTVVGSRDLSAPDADLAAAVGRGLAQAGYTVVSGGAPGTDTTAVQSALRVAPAWEILPHGLHLAGAGAPWSASVARAGLLRLSSFAPLARFTAAQAMERNTLLYSLGIATVVVRCHLDTGGTWRGATDALRRRLGPVFVFCDDANFARCGTSYRAGAQALVARGATPVTDVAGLLSALATLPRVFVPDVRQASLFA